MRKKVKSGVSAIILTLLLFLWSGCSTEEQLFQNPAYLQTTFELKSPSAMDGKISIREAYLKLDRIQAIGNGEMHTDITHPVPADEPPFQLSKADSSQIKLRLPGRAYEAMDFNLFLITDNYQLVFVEAPVTEEPVDTGDNDNGGGTDGDYTGGDSSGGSVDQPSGNDGSVEDEDTPPTSSDDDGKDNDADSNDDGDNNDPDKNQGKDEKEKDKKKDKEDKDRKNRGDKDDDDDERDDDEGDDDDDDDGRKASIKNTSTLNLDHFFQNARPGLLITGVYENNGKTINMIFASSGLEKLTVRAKQNDSFSIRLKENNNAEITFDAAKWLQSIGPEAIESARIQTYQGQAVLFIHKDFNSHLYDILTPQLEIATELSIVAREDSTF
ncbi:MAG: hypothetical protein WA874_02100 [Chryseosolibacter sp.]